MKITYIHHSSFSVELERSVLLFDYFQGEIPEFDPEESVYVFASHKHHDHYDKKIFELAERYPHILFILSGDIRMNSKYMDRIGIPNPARDRIRYIGKNVSCEYREGQSSISVETLASTDEGVAFIVNCEGRSIYHAGDLNWWKWREEGDEWNRSMERDFLREMAKIRGRHFELVFLPLDPRQEEDYYLGFDCFMKTAHADRAFPMHCWGDFSVIERLKKDGCSLEYRDKIIEIKKDGDSYEI